MLEPVLRILEREEVLDPRADDVLLVVRGHDQRDAGRDVVLLYVARAQAPQPGRGERVADVRPREPAQARPEERLPDHAVTVPSVDEARGEVKAAHPAVANVDKEPRLEEVLA